MREAVLLIDFGSTYTKLTAVDLVGQKILATGRAHTTVKTGILQGLEVAQANLTRKLEEPLHFVRKIACSSAAGGLRMVAIGLVKDLTAEAAKRAALGAGARVLKVFAQRLNQQEAVELVALNPDIILLAGGTDGGNAEVIIYNARILAATSLQTPVIIAGNKSATDEVEAILVRAGKEVYLCENVMPELNQLNIDPARQTIRDIFMSKIVRAKGLDKVEKLIDGVLLPTPAAVLNAVALLALGTPKEKGIGDLILVDIGGATTDVHSVAEGLPSKGNVSLKGLPEPLAKRTVEGDLGMRYSLSSLFHIGHTEGYISDEATGEWTTYLRRSEQEPDWLPQQPKEWEMDTVMARVATKTALDRHVGKLDSSYTPFGVSFLQYGKDLTQVKWVIGTGGVIVEHSDPVEILKESIFDATNPTLLKPQEPEFLVDSHYILAAMGLLKEIIPDVALRMMKDNLKALRRGNELGTK